MSTNSIIFHAREKLGQLENVPIILIRESPSFMQATCSAGRKGWRELNCESG